MDILKKEEILACPDRTPVRGYVLIQSYSPQPQKNGGQYIRGKLHAVGDMSFMIWSSSDPSGAFVKMLSTDEFTGKICQVSGYVNVYGGEHSLILEKVIIVDGKELGLSDSDFYSSVYDADKYFEDLRKLVNKYCSPNAVLVYEMLMKDIQDRFKYEFAAISHHDNVRSGLIAHTTKVFRIGTLIRIYPGVLERVGADTLFLGCALHDIGKVYEYAMGVISDIGKVISHLTIGVMMLKEREEEIVRLLGSDVYYDLISIVAQHSGEFGDRPRTIAAYVVHLCDDMEAKMATLESAISNSRGDQIQLDGQKLS